MDVPGETEIKMRHFINKLYYHHSAILSRFTYLDFRALCRNIVPTDHLIDMNGENFTYGKILNSNKT